MSRIQRATQGMQGKCYIMQWRSQDLPGWASPHPEDQNEAIPQLSPIKKLSPHPEDQNEEETEENLRKNKPKYRKMRKDWGNILILPTREWEASYGPDIMLSRDTIRFPTFPQFVLTYGCMAQQHFCSWKFPRQYSKEHHIRKWNGLARLKA